LGKSEKSSDEEIEFDFSGDDDVFCDEDWRTFAEIAR